MEQFTNQEFRTKLYATIAEIENNSQVELVVIIQPNSGKYLSACYLFAALFTFVTFSFLMFSSLTFYDDILFLCTVLSFPFAFYVCKLISAMKKLFVSKKEMQRNVEIYARAFYQKGGIHHTSAKIGTLVYISYFEKIAYLVTDRGTESMIPGEELNLLRNKFSGIFKSKNIAQNLLQNLTESQEVFSKYIPSVPNDINEIPDDLKVHF